jgi:hypothetical protein
MKRLLIAVSAALLGACVNPYRANFNSTTDRYPAWMAGRFAPSAAKPRLIKTEDIQEEGRKLAEKGYLMVGYSKFDHPALDENLALQEGKAVGADVVLLQKTFAKSLIETTTVTQWPPSETTELHENTRVEGESEKDTKHIDRRVEIRTSHGPETTYVPTQVDYYEHSATYWRKVSQPIFGAIVRDLSDEQKLILETNRGLVVRTIVTDSPAFQADLLKGDIILKIDGEPVASMQRFYDDLINKAGKKSDAFHPSQRQEA